MTPCPRCAQPLHWVAQYQQWYCATCQTYVPPAAPPQAAPPPQAAAPAMGYPSSPPVQPMGYPSAPPAAGPTGPAHVPPPGGSATKRGSRRWLLVVGALVVVSGGITAAVLLTGGKEERADCARYGAHYAELTVGDRTDRHREEARRDLSAAAESQCVDRLIPAAEANCVIAATTREAALECGHSGIGMLGAGGMEDRHVAMTTSAEDVARRVVGGILMGETYRVERDLVEWQVLMWGLECSKEMREVASWLFQRRGVYVESSAKLWKARNGKVRSFTMGTRIDVAPEDSLFECTPIEPVAIQPVSLELEYDADGGRAVHAAQITMIRIRDRWYAFDVPTIWDEREPAHQDAMRAFAEQHPEPPRARGFVSGGSAAEPPGDADGAASDALSELQGIREFACACTTKTCAESVQSLFATFLDRHASSMPTGPDGERFQQLAVEIGECMANAVIGVANTPPPAPAPNGASATGLAECDDYLAAIEAFVTCEGIPQASRDSMRDAVAQMKVAWKDLANTPAAVRDATADACRDGAKATRDNIKTLGCD